MSRQSRQAELRKRMAEARSKLQISAFGDDEQQQQQPHVDKKPPPSAASSILKRPKYTSNNTERVGVDGDQNNNALSGLIGGYSSSDDEDVGEKHSAVASKKRDAPTSPDKQDIKKRAKFSADVHVRAITSDEDVDSHQQMKVDTTVAMNQAAALTSQKKTQNTEPKKELAGEKISDEVWDEFNALLDDEPDISAVDEGSDSIQKGGGTDTEPNAEQTHVSTDASAAAPSSKLKKKKKKKKKQSTDNSYDNEAVNNVEQASYEARLARLVLLKQKSKTNDNILDSVNFYDPGLAFQQEDDEGEGDAASIGREETAAGDSLNESLDNNSQTVTNATTITNAPRVSLAKILRKRREEAKKISSHGEDADDSELADGRWF